MPAQPSLFISHGSPLLALDAGSTGAAWRRVAAALSTPVAIVIVSAHWETDIAALTAVDRLATIHDFGGFPEPLYQIEYPARGAPALAQQAADLLRRANIDAVLDTQRGLDHGAWVPLREMFPEASIPVVQLSLQAKRGPQYHYRVGRALAELAQQNILPIGSGSLTHNLQDGFRAMRGDTQALHYVPEFQRWVFDALTRGDLDALFSYRTVARCGSRAHPSEEHFMPLFFALGAAGENPAVIREYDSIADSVLGMDVYRFMAKSSAV